MARLGVYRDFFRDFLKLEKPVQDQVIEVFPKFEEATYAGLHLEPVKNAQDKRMHSIRITDFWRGGIPVTALAKKHTDTAVGVGTMHRMKGMEFRCVAVIGVGEHAVPPASAITPAPVDLIAHHQDLQRERCLLFVAATRAREELTISRHGAPSVFLLA
ncbi:3'-5' exonuclease [Sphaerimonospora cavernae]|uniref:3'-5' exonuclease n=1 Tax=Sphaerimonospora cavernae TaxID=1740611 RepID=A0ABV6U8C1_9ACTN